MEDYNSNLLNDSKNEWSIRLMNILSGHIIDGFRSIFNEALTVCEKNEEPEKYLMTFQNFLSRIPKWNQNMIEKESQRIVDNSKCSYLDDLITCIHIIELKILSCVRTSNHNQKIEIDIPNFTSFLHNVYINIARKLYSNIYLFQIDITSLEQQKNNREFELIVQTCIMNTVRDNIPIDQLLKQYIDETQEIDIEKTEKIISKEEISTDVSSNDLPTSSTSASSTDNTSGTEETKSVEAPSNVIHTDLTKTNDTVTNDTVISENVKFSENVESFDPVNKETTFSPIQNEAKQDAYESDNDSYDEKDSLKIGENISLNIGEDIADSNMSITDENVNLNFEDLNESVNDIIDLGATELDL